MLNIFDDLMPFFEDNYRRINVREYARIRKISPPSASKLLKNLRKENLLNVEKEKNYIYYYANREDKLFIELCRAYFLMQLNSSGLIKHILNEYLSPLTILFGSLSKAEAKSDSDIDIAVFSPTEKKMDLSKFEKKLKRKIDLFKFKDKNDVKTSELMNSILNGFIITGGW